MAVELEIGSEFAGYRVESFLGRGGMSVVYVAQHLRLQRKVALKVLAHDLANDPSFRERFVRESRMAAAIDHPNIIPIYDAGEANGILYIAMRYVDGTDLAGLIKREGSLAPERAVSICAQVASALDAAHVRGLVHRDVKPGNILISLGAGPGGTDHCYLSDFGLTKQAQAQTGLTAAGQFVGTLHYMAPEQIQGKRLDGRADEYALTCVLYQCLTGVVPFERDSDISVLYAHLQEPPPRISASQPGFPPGLDDVIARGLAKDPASRYPTCTDLVRAAEEQLQTGARVTAPIPPTRVATIPVPAPPLPFEAGPGAPPPPAGTPTGRRASRRPWVIAGAVLLVVIVAVVAVLLATGKKGKLAGGTTPTHHPTHPSPTGPTVVPTTASPTASPTSSPTASATSSPGPDPRAIPLSQFLRPGTHRLFPPIFVDLNGDGIDEAIVTSEANAAPAQGGPPVPFLDVWSFNGSTFQRVFDATITDPQLAPSGAPDPMIDASNPEAGNQELSFVHVVDFRGNGRPDIVAGITFIGAGVGPMDVWAFGMKGSVFVTDFFHDTEQDGTLTTSGRTELLDTPFFHKNDPLCCPSAIEHDTIGLNTADGKIEIVKQFFTKPS